jgi:heme exporter protein A
MQACRLSADAIACRRGDRILFRGVSLALGAGEALRVTGPNGEAGLVDERPALDPHLPLDQALAFWERFDGHKADAVERLGLGPLGEVPVRFLSTGQKKRAALARLMAQDCPIWLLDEPLNGLDVDAVALVERIVAEHCAGGGLAVVASHQPMVLPGDRAIHLPEFAA